MRTVFLPDIMEKGVKVSGDFVRTGYVCPFSRLRFTKMVTGSFGPHVQISNRLVNLC